MIRRFELRGETRLALVLLTAALLVSIGRHSGLMPHIVDDLDLSASAMGFAVIAGRLGGFAVIGVALVVDRFGPYPVMPLGALVTAAGLLVLSFAGGYGSLVTTSAVIGLGTAAVSATILFAVAAKGCYRLRGTVIGSLAFLIKLDPVSLAAGPAADAFGWRWVAVVFAALSLAAALILLTFLPRVFPVRQRAASFLRWRPVADHEDDLTWHELRRTPGFWKVVGAVILVFALGNAVSTTTFVSTLSLLYDQSRLGVGTMSLLLFAWTLGALFWGIASDFVPVRRLISSASIVVVLSIPLLWLLDGPLLDLLGILILGLGLGATLSLPWVLLADHVGVRFFAIVGIGVSFVGGLAGGLAGSLLSGLTVEVWGAAGAGGLLAAFALVLAAASFRAPQLRFGGAS